MASLAQPVTLTGTHVVLEPLAPEHADGLADAGRERATGRLAGMTNDLHIDNVHRRVEIGATGYARRVQRTALNPESSLGVRHLRLQHHGPRMADAVRTHLPWQLDQPR